MNELDEKIIKFGWLFKDRLENGMLEDAINYVGHGERGLAFETICDHLSEFEINITQEEYNLAMDLSRRLDLNVDDISLNHLKELVIN